jgi:hypothetical protein
MEMRLMAKSKVHIFKLFNTSHSNVTMLDYFCILMHKFAFCIITKHHIYILDSVFCPISAKPWTKFMAKPTYVYKLIVYTRGELFF